ncbi:MAG: hypothetical protein ABI337_06695 [Nitrososphaera sp.]|jgi:hypothetical protein
MTTRCVNSEKRFVIIALITGGVALIAIFGYASQGYVRQFNIFWPEVVRQTLEFQTLDGHTVVVGTEGNGGTNPELIMRAGDYSYIITVINKDTKPHQLYVDGVELKTKLLEPSDIDTITIISKKEETFNYYDVANGKELLGTIRAIRVTLTE